MILETAQLLCTAHRVLDGTVRTVEVNHRKKKVYELNSPLDQILYSATHVNHPSAVWVREGYANYAWTYWHFIALCEEYTFRYGKIHATEAKLSSILWHSPQNLAPGFQTTPKPNCMAPEYIISNDVVTNYRNYYNYGKTSLLRWTKRQPPNWIIGKIIQADERPIYTVSR